MMTDFSNTLRQLRKEKEVNQEALANAMNVSIQAVSKWETGLSYPDIDLLPDIAQFFGVTIDYLLTGKAPAEPKNVPDPADTEGLQIVVAWYKDGEMLCREFPEQPICLTKISPKRDEERKVELTVSIYGNAQVAGSISGDVSARGHIQCEKVNGDVEMASTVKTTKVNGNVKAELVQCTRVNGNVYAKEVYGPVDVKGHINIDNNEEDGE